jgi:hypothetical protein
MLHDGGADGTGDPSGILPNVRGSGALASRYPGTTPRDRPSGEPPVPSVAGLCLIRIECQLTASCGRCHVGGRPSGRRPDGAGGRLRGPLIGAVTEHRRLISGSGHGVDPQRISLVRLSPATTDGAICPVCPSGWIWRRAHPVRVQ